MCLTWLASMVLGLGLGVLLTRLLFLLIRLAIRIDVPLVGSVSVQALLITLALFAALFLLLIIYNGWQVRSVNPVKLLHGGQTGEREPKQRLGGSIAAALEAVRLGASIVRVHDVAATVQALEVSSAIREYSS